MTVPRIQSPQEGHRIYWRGIRVRPTQDLRLFRPSVDVPVLRGTAITMSKREGYLWTTGYVPRFRTYPGFETPKPILVELNRGDADLNIVMADVLALTEVNYNACDYVSGLPVTLKFADRVGEILTASPRGRSGCPRAESRRDYQKASGEFTIIHGRDLPLRVIVARLVEALRLPNDVPNFVVCL